MYEACKFWAVSEFVTSSEKIRENNKATWNNKCNVKYICELTLTYVSESKARSIYLL